MQRSNTNRQRKSLESSNFLSTPLGSGGEGKNRKRCCATENVFFPLVKSPCHEDKDADVDNTWLRARQQMWCNYGMMYQALKLPHHLHDYRSDRVRKRALTKKYPRLSSGEKKKKRGGEEEEEEGEKGALVERDFSFRLSTRWTRWIWRLKACCSTNLFTRIDFKT